MTRAECEPTVEIAPPFLLPTCGMCGYPKVVEAVTRVALCPLDDDWPDRPAVLVALGLAPA